MHRRHVVRNALRCSSNERCFGAHCCFPPTFGPARMSRAAHARCADGKSCVEAVGHATVCLARSVRWTKAPLHGTGGGSGAASVWHSSIRNNPAGAGREEMRVGWSARLECGGTGCGPGDTFARAFDSRTAHQAAIEASVGLDDWRNTGVVPSVFSSRGGSAAVVEPLDIRQTRVISQSK